MSVYFSLSQYLPTAIARYIAAKHDSRPKMVYRASWGEKPGQKPDRVGIKTLFKIFVYCALMQTGGSVLSTASDKGHAAAPTPPDPATTPGVWGALLLPMGLFLTWVVTPQNKRGVAHPLPEINLPPSVEGPSPVLATPPHRGILAQVPGHKSGLHRKCDPEGTELGPSPEGGTRNLGEEGEDQTLPTPKSGTPKTCARGGHPHPPPYLWMFPRVHAAGDLQG